MRVVFLITLVCSALPAAPITDLFNTGLGSPGSVDPHWTIDGRQAFVTDPTQYPFPAWVTNADAGWLSPQAHYVGNSDAADTTFTFATTFNLPTQFVSAFIVMQLATDNGLQDVKLNGTSVEFLKSTARLPGNTSSTSVILEGTGFSTGLGASLSILSGFQPGQNKLEFYVRNSVTNPANDGNPTGMIAAFTSGVINSDVSESPEPANLVLMGSGLAFFGWVAAMRRFKHTHK